MRTDVRLKVDMAVRVRDFLRANPFASANGQAVTAAFEERLARVLELIARIDQGELTRRSAVRHKRDLRQQLRTVALRHLARVATAAAREKPELAVQFRMPSRATEQEFRAAAGNIALLTTSNRELLDRYGLDASIPDELNGGLEQLDRLMVEVNDGRMAHTGARMELLSLSSELLGTVRQLDGMMLFRYREEPGLQGSWASARNVAWARHSPKPETPAA
ncbi:MAG: hypothetical protein ACYC2K_00700 [Gemmatimonadales bacterium]